MNINIYIYIYISCCFIYSRIIIFRAKRYILIYFAVPWLVDKLWNLLSQFGSVVFRYYLRLQICGSRNYGVRNYWGAKIWDNDQFCPEFRTPLISHTVILRRYYGVRNYWGAKIWDNNPFCPEFRTPLICNLRYIKLNKFYKFLKFLVLWFINFYFT